MSHCTVVRPSANAAPAAAHHAICASIAWSGSGGSKSNTGTR
jgi:hypothetical protein